MLRFLRKTVAGFFFFTIDVVDGLRYALSLVRLGPHAVHGVRVILVKGQNVLLVSHWYAPFIWTLPGGGLHEGETPAEAAKREVMEETGYEVRSLEGLVGTYAGRGRGDKTQVFYTNDFGGSLSTTPNREIMARSWFPMNDLPQEVSPANRRRIEAFRSGIREESGQW